MDFDTLKIFYRAAQAGSFLHSGVHLSPSAIGRKIATLEEELGTTLFLRKRNGVELTASGFRFLGRVEKLLFEFDSAKNEIKSGEANSASIHVTTPSVWASGFLVPALVEYQKTHTTGSITLTGQDHLTPPTALELLIQVFPFKDSNKNSDSVLIGKTKLKLFAHRTYLKNVPEPKNLKQLKDHPLIAHTNRLYPFVNFSWFIDRAKDEDIILSPALSTNNVIPFLTSGFGIATLVENHPLVVSGELINVLPNVIGPEVEIFMTVHKIHKHYNQVLSFKKLLTEKLRDKNTF